MLANNINGINVEPAYVQIFCFIDAEFFRSQYSLGIYSRMMILKYYFHRWNHKSIYRFVHIKYGTL